LEEAVTDGRSREHRQQLLGPPVSLTPLLVQGIRAATDFLPMRSHQGVADLPLPEDDLAVVLPAQSPQVPSPATVLEVVAAPVLDHLGIEQRVVGNVMQRNDPDVQLVVLDEL